MCKSKGEGLFAHIIVCSQMCHVGIWTEAEERERKRREEGVTRARITFFFFKITSVFTLQSCGTVIIGSGWSY